MDTIDIDVWLYGELARFGGGSGGHANLQIKLTQGATVAELLAKLQMDTRERGFTFINGNLSAMPGMQKDLGHELKNGDRIAFFHLKSMWPFQYRQGVAATKEINDVLRDSNDQALHHTYQVESFAESVFCHRKQPKRHGDLPED